MALTDEQLLMLDNLIYTNFAKENRSVGEIITLIEQKNYKIKAAEMTPSEWKTLCNNIKNDPELLNYKVKDYVDDEKTGMRAACFVNSDYSDVNVVFRGTHGDYEWHDNGQGGYLDDTKQQKRAAEYVKNLPKEYGNNITVTGHSKGGNKAQYVTITTDRIARCVSYDGQGFSEDFLKKYSDEIRKKSDRITSISASDDFVNCLLYPIAGTRIYIETEKQDKFIYYHKPNILLDENGKLRPQTEQSELSKIIQEYTTYMASNIPEPERSYTIDGVVSYLEKGQDKESAFQRIIASVNAVSHLDDFVFDFIGERYGIMGETMSAYFAACVFPHVFWDDLINAERKNFENRLKRMLEIAEKMKPKFSQIFGVTSDFGNAFICAVNVLQKKLCVWRNERYNVGFQYATVNPYIVLNTTQMHTYAGQLQSISARAKRLDEKMNRLYVTLGIEWSSIYNLANLMKAGVLLDYSYRLDDCSKYIEQTATDFENVERSLINIST